MGNFQLCSYETDGQSPAAGLIVGDAVHRVAVQPGVLDLLSSWAQVLPELEQQVRHIEGGGAEGVPLERVQLLSPVLYPGALYCAGANYADHIAEMARVSGDIAAIDPRASLGKPWHFVRPSRGCVVGPAARIARPEGCLKLDWEVELAAVIGAPARRVTVDDALDHVAAYTVAIDLSARDLSRRPKVDKGSPFYYDWLAHKGFEGSCPIGPWLTPRADVADPQRLAIQLRVNGELMQDSNTSQMVFSVAEQIAHISQYVTLFPGDVVLTGCPAGVGAARGRFLSPGDTVSAYVEGLGSLDVAIA